MTAVLWDDGSAEGDPWLKDSEEALAVGQTQQLRRVLEIVQESAPSQDSTVTPMSLVQVRSAIDALPIALDTADPASTALSTSGRQQWVESGQQQVKGAVLKDIDDYVRANPEPDPVSTRAWIATARGRYLAWLKTTTKLWSAARRESAK